MLMALLIGEVVVRFVAPQQLIVAPTGIYRPDPVFGWRHKEELEVNVNTGEGPVLFRTDENGYRIGARHASPEFDTRNAAKRVLTIGDSFLEAAAVDADDTLPSLLESQLSSRLGYRIVVDNDSAAGWDPNQYLFAVKRAIERNTYHAAIIFLYIGNDITESRVERYMPEHVASRHEFRVPLAFSRKEWIESFFYPINDRLETTSHLFVLAKQRLQVPLAKVGLTTMYFPSIFRRSEHGAASWQVTSEICETIDKTLHQHGVRALFVLIPTPYQVDAESFQGYVSALSIDIASVDLEQPNTILRESFAKRSLQLVDPLFDLRARQLSGIPLYGTIDRHFNKNGHCALAETVLPFAEALLEGVPTL
jgi:hypothetical protein